MIFIQRSMNFSKYIVNKFSKIIKIKINNLIKLLKKYTKRMDNISRSFKNLMKS